MGLWDVFAWSTIVIIVVSVLFLIGYFDYHYQIERVRTIAKIAPNAVIILK